MSLTDEQRVKLDRAQEILDWRFENTQYLLSAITHPSATEGRAVKFSYERLEFLGDSILGALVANEAFHRFPDLDEGGLTRIKVALVSGASLSEVAEKLGFADIIVFGSSETGTGRRGLHSALENVYEAVVAALYLDGGVEVAASFVERTLIPKMSLSLAREPENPKSALQEKLQEGGITPTYKLVETQGPPHDRTFVAQVYAGDKGLEGGREPGGEDYLGAPVGVFRHRPFRRAAGREGRREGRSGRGEGGHTGRQGRRARGSGRCQGPG
jgi:ribonuclease-3